MLHGSVIPANTLRISVCCPVVVFIGLPSTLLVNDIQSLQKVIITI